MLAYCICTQKKVKSRDAEGGNVDLFNWEAVTTTPETSLSDNDCFYVLEGGWGEQSNVQQGL